MLLTTFSSHRYQSIVIVVGRSHGSLAQSRCCQPEFPRADGRRKMAENFGSVKIEDSCPKICDVAALCCVDSSVISRGWALLI
jgi:hypothetical protein